jgi:hypothetical protein
MIPNVVPFHHVARDYSDYWPKVGYGQVLQRIWDNIPQALGSVEYSYAFKADIEGSVCSVVVKRMDSEVKVLFNACDNVQDNNDLKAWFILNDKKLRRLLKEEGKLIIVGKVGHNSGERTFLVHYIIKDGEVYLDEVSLRKILEPGDFGSTIFIVPSTEIVNVNINRTTGGVNFPFLNNLQEGLTVLGLPVNVIIPRDNGGAPVFKTSLIHMRFMAFTHITPHRLTESAA